MGRVDGGVLFSVFEVLNKLHIEDVLVLDPGHVETCIVLAADIVLSFEGRCSKGGRTGNLEISSSLSFWPIESRKKFEFGISAFV